jgi:hypothetical protein
MRKPLLVAPIGCYFDNLTAVRTTLNCARRHDFFTFPSHCYCHTYLFITKSALRLTKVSVVWREESLFVGRRVVVGGAIAVIWASETNFVWNYLSETIENHLKLFENVWNYFVWKYFVWKQMKRSESNGEPARKMSKRLTDRSRFRAFTGTPWFGHGVTKLQTLGKESPRVGWPIWLVGTNLTENASYVESP